MIQIQNFSLKSYLVMSLVNARSSVVASGHLAYSGKAHSTVSRTSIPLHLRSLNPSNFMNSSLSSCFIQNLPLTLLSNPGNGFSRLLMQCTFGNITRRSCNVHFPRTSLCQFHVSTVIAQGKSDDSVRANAGQYSPNVPARLAQKKKLLDERTEEFTIEDEDPIQPITEDKVSVSFARSGGPGGQNVNKVNTKVDMRFNVFDAEWLPERVRLKLLDQEKNRINSDGELVVSSTRTRTQRGNIEDALQKLQEIIDKAAYRPPPPSEEKKKRINKLAKAENEKRLNAKKQQGSKKADRRNKGSWD